MHAYIIKSSHWYCLKQRRIKVDRGGKNFILKLGWNLKNGFYENNVLQSTYVFEINSWAELLIKAAFIC